MSVYLYIYIIISIFIYLSISIYLSFYLSMIISDSPRELLEHVIQDRTHQPPKSWREAIAKVDSMNLQGN